MESRGGGFQSLTFGSLGIGTFSSKFSWCFYMIHWNSTTNGQRFRAQHMSTILSEVVKDSSLFSKKSLGNVLSNKEYFSFIFPITLSTCIRILTFVFRLVNSTSPGFNSFMPLVKDGMTNCVPYVRHASEIFNPLSAVTFSSWFIFLKKFEFSVVCWPLDLPPHTCEKKEIEPCGVIPIKYFAVLWCF